MPLRIGAPLPELSGATAWLNSRPDPQALSSRPLLVHFWSTSCDVCHDNMPQVRNWREEYAPAGLQVIAIHMPRQEEDTDVARVSADVAQMGLTEPCAIDNQLALAQAFQNEYVPAYFLFTPQGTLCGRAAGYNGLKLIEQPLHRLIDTAACELPNEE